MEDSTQKLEKIEKLKSNIRLVMSAQGISAYNLTKRIGCKRTAVYDLLEGRTKNPSIFIVSDIAKTLGCKIDDLLCPDHTELFLTKK